MAFNSTDLTMLEAAIASGVLEVRYGDKTVRYNSLSDMLKLRDQMQLELGITPPTKAHGRMTTGVYGGSGEYSG